MADFSPDKLIAWAKEHKEIVIPAVAVGGIAGVYYLSQHGGLSANAPTPPQAGDPTNPTPNPGGGTGGADYGSAIADLTNQLQQSNTQNASGLAGLLQQFQQFQQQITQSLGDITGQTNAALQAQANQTNAALGQLASQQGSGELNGLGQLLQQLPQYTAQAQNYAAQQTSLTMPHYTESIGQINYGDIPLAKTLNQGAYNAGSSVRNVILSIFNRAQSNASRLNLPTPTLPTPALPRNPFAGARASIGTPTPTLNPFAGARASGGWGISLGPALPRNPVVNPPAGARRVIGVINTQYGRGH